MFKSALIANLPTGNYIRDDRCQVPADVISSALRAPADLLYYATILKRRGTTVRLRDYPAEGLDEAAFLADLRELRPDLLVVSLTTPTLERDLRCLELAKRLLPEMLTVAKGAHLVTNDVAVLERCAALDIAIRNEAEAAIDELTSGRPLTEILGITWRDGERVKRNAHRTPALDLDWLPLPDRSLLRNELYVRPDTGEPQATVVAARGCPNACIFCLVKVVSGLRICRRSPESLVAEVRDCVERHGIRDFYFRADAFTWERDWVLAVCDRLIESGLRVRWVTNSRVNSLDDLLAAKLRAAGCWMLGLGIESGDPTILAKISKGATLDQARAAVATCRRHGIKTYGFYVLGFPWDDERTIARTIRFSRELDTDFVEFHLAYPFPGTELHELAVRDGLFETSRLAGSDVMASPMRTFSLSESRLRELRRSAIRGYYLRPSFLWRTLRGIRSPRVLLNYFRKGWSLLASL